MTENDIQTYMTEDQFEINNSIENILSKGDILDNSSLEHIIARLRRHIFIEETVLFPTLPKSSEEDVIYLEKEHGKILKALNSLMGTVGNEIRKNVLSEVYDILIEHNSYEESFVYEYFEKMDVKKIKELQPPATWKSVFE